MVNVKPLKSETASTGERAHEADHPSSLVALFGADKPLRLEGLERAFVGRSIAEATEPAAQAASAEAAPTNDQHGSAEFRRGLLRGLVRRLAGEFTEAMA